MIVKPHDLGLDDAALVAQRAFDNRERGLKEAWQYGIDMSAASCVWDGQGGDLERCLICGRRLAAPYLYWSCDQSFGVHIGCWPHVAIALMRDVMEFHCGKERANTWYQEGKATFLEMFGTGKPNP